MSYYLPKGTAFTRYAMALAVAKGDLMQAAAFAEQWDGSTPEVGRVLKTAVAAGTTTDATWAAPLVEYQVMASEFIELLMPQTIIGRIPGIRPVPFNISMSKQATAGNVGWVGEGRAAPLGSLAFDNNMTLRWAKAAGIVVLTKELARFSSPAAEAVVRSDLLGAMTKFLDRQFVDPVVAEVSNISPASITYGVTPRVASGPDLAAWEEDFDHMLQAYLAANLSLAGAVLLMTELQAMRFAQMKTTAGAVAYPDIGANGGSMWGIPVVASENVIATEDPASPQAYEAGGLIILAKASEIMLADDGQTFLDSSGEASLQMDDDPAEPTADTTVLVSLWQRGLVGLKAERVINWKKRHASAVQYITGAAYTPVAA